jgi:hypothetical protein
MWHLAFVSVIIESMNLSFRAVIIFLACAFHILGSLACSEVELIFETLNLSRRFGSALFWTGYQLIARLLLTQDSTTQKIADIRGSIQKFPDLVDNEINAYNNKQSLRSNIKGYGDKTH